MSASVLFMSMSLDGFIADPADSLGGDDGNRLHDWALTPDKQSFRTSEAPGAFVDEINATGAVLAPSKSSTTGVAITTASRSSCRVIGRLDHRSPAIPS